LKKWAAHAGDPPVAKIRAVDIRGYLAWLANDYRPTRFGKQSREPLSPKTVHNVWISLSAFFTWASNEFGCDNPMKQVSKPRYEPKPFQPYTREEVEALLKACEKSKDVITRNRRRFAMRTPLAERNQALVLVLLDSGLRSGELCALTLGDYDEQTGKLEVEHGRAGGAKGRKGRVVYLGKAAVRRPCTITSYGHDLRVWLDHTGDKDWEVTGQKLRVFLLCLRTAVFGEQERQFLC
jgi:integrase/recombinase XerD